MLFVVGAIGGGFVYKRKYAGKKCPCPILIEEGTAEETAAMTGETAEATDETAAMTEQTAATTGETAATTEETDEATDRPIAQAENTQ